MPPARPPADLPANLPATPAAAPRSRAATVALGIFSSRLAGFVRERAVAHYLGLSGFADVLTTAFRAPNVLQNLLGEQSLSAAFIPGYSRLLAEGREQEAGRFAGAMLGLLLVVAGALSLLGTLLARPLVALFAAGYLQDASLVAQGAQTLDRFELTVEAVRWVFPMTGLLVISAWALGVLNSHRRFFLPYFAPVLWNSAIVAALVYAAGGIDLRPGVDLGRLVIAAAIGALAGGALQLGVQLPLVFRLLAGFRLSVSTRVAGVREALAAFAPALAGRGVVQLSLYLDHLLATMAAVGAVAAIRWGSFLYALPISLFGLSVAAAELPELARLRGEASERIRARVDGSLCQMLFLVVPTAVGFLAFGWLIVAAVYLTGEFTQLDAWLVYAVLAAYSLGLPASSASRLVQNLFWALGDTRTPARVAMLRVAASALLGGAAMLWLDRFEVAATFGLEPGGKVLFLGAVGLALGSAVGAWLELGRLLSALRRALPGFGLPLAPCLAFSGYAACAALPAAGAWFLVRGWHQLPAAALVLAFYVAAYFGLAAARGRPEAGLWLSQLRRRR